MERGPVLAFYDDLGVVGFAGETGYDRNSVDTRGRSGGAFARLPETLPAIWSRPLSIYKKERKVRRVRSKERVSKGGDGWG